MATFSEYVGEALLGPPLSRNSSGEIYWQCPVCGKGNREQPKSLRFHLRPVSRQFPNQRFNCFACVDAWGDVSDLIKLVVDELDSFPTARKARMTAASLAKSRELKAEYLAWKRSGKSDAPNPCELPNRSGSGTVVFSSQGNRELSDRPRMNKADLHDIYETLAEGQKGILTKALKIARKHKADLTELAEYTVGFDESRRESDEEHRQSCDDPNCDAAVCRQARGLEPLTKEQIEAHKKRDQEEREKFNKSHAYLESWDLERKWKRLQRQKKTNNGER